MNTENETFVERWKTRIVQSSMGRLFLDKKFFRYTLIGIFISVLNIFLLWLLIDVMGIPTIISGTMVVGGTFILRYVLFSVFKIL